MKNFSNKLKHGYADVEKRVRFRQELFLFFFFKIRDFRNRDEKKINQNLIKCRRTKKSFQKMYFKAGIRTNSVSIFFKFILVGCVCHSGGGGIFLLVFRLDLESYPLKSKTFLKIYEWKKQTVCVYRAAEKWRGNIFVSVSPSTSVTSWNSGETQLLKKWLLEKASGGVRGHRQRGPVACFSIHFDAKRVCSQNVDFFVCLRPYTPFSPFFSLLFTRPLRTRYFYSLSTTSMTAIHIIGCNIVEIPLGNFWIFNIVLSWENWVD